MTPEKNNKKNETNSRYTKQELEKRKKTCKFFDKAQPVMEWVGIILLIVVFIWLLCVLVNNLGSNETTKPGSGNNPVVESTTTQDETTNPSDENDQTTEEPETTEKPEDNKTPTDDQTPDNEEEDNDVPRYITIDLNEKVKDFGKAPVNYPTAWTEKKMNSVISKGVKEAADVDANAAFNFEANLMYVTYDEKTESYSATFQFNGKEDAGEELKNVSIYQDENANLVVYGYTNDGKAFEKVTLDGKNSIREVLTYDVNLPFFAKKESETSIRIADEFTLCVLANEFFAIYKDGQELTIVQYEDTFPIKEYDLSHGYFITTKGQIYTLSVSMTLTGEPKISYEFAGSVKENGKFGYILVELTDDDEPIELPVFITEGGKEMVLVPYGFEGFKSQSPVYTDEVRADAPASRWHLIDLKDAERVESSANKNESVVYSLYYKHFAKK